VRGHEVPGVAADENAPGVLADELADDVGVFAVVVGVVAHTMILPAPSYRGFDSEGDGLDLASTLPAADLLA